MKKFLIFLFISVVASQTVDPTTFCASKAAGLYQYPGTLNCTQYIKCYLYNSVMNGAMYTCMGITLFNPAIALCVTDWTCIPDISTTTLAPTTTSTTIATTTTTTSPTTTTTSPTTTTTSPTTTTTLSTTTTSATTTTTSSGSTTTLSPNFCSSKPAGLYPYPGSQDCKQYIKCYLYNSVMNQAVYSCVGTTLFNPGIALCVTGYTCIPVPDVTTSTTSTTTSTTQEPITTTEEITTQPETTTEQVTTTELDTTTSIDATTPEPFDPVAFCFTLEKGYYRYSYNSSCILLVYCYKNNGIPLGVVVIECIDEPIVSTTLAAPFDPTEFCATKDVDFYQVPINSTCTALVYCLNPGGIIVEDCIESQENEDIEMDEMLDVDSWCSIMPVGDFPYPGFDDTCSLYVECYELQGLMHGIEMSCDVNSFFDPAIMACNVDFGC